MIHTTHRIPLLTQSLILLMSLLLPSTASAQPNFDDQHISATLQASADPVPGSTLILAMNFTLDDHWHTYWPGINDTGYGLSLDIPPVDGLTFDKPYFPTPTRHLAPGSILDHIYEDTLQVLIPVTVSKDLKPGTKLTIDITANALVCDEVCIPETANASITLTVSDTPSTLDQQITTDYNNRATNLIDPEIDWLQTSGPDAEYGVTLKIKDATRYQFFPASDCTQPGNLIVEGDTKSDTLIISFDRTYDEPTDPVRLSGRLRVKINDTWHVYNIHESLQPSTQEITP